MYIENEQSTVMRVPHSYNPPRSWLTWLLGRPLSTADAPHQTINKKVGLAVFASDALSSTAYATQEILVVLAMAGTAAFSLAFPIALGIVLLLAIVTISYEQTIHAYPGGGGAYIVARDNLGELPAQTAGAALLTDYILTVAVSISSGVAQVISAFPQLFHWRVEIAVALVLLVMLINLRGVKESGVTFAIPTYFFLALMIFTVGAGLFRFFTHSLGVVSGPPPLEAVENARAISLFLILHAFANGTTALTGVEAISNGITAFKEPKSHNAGVTLVWMSLILGGLFLGITFLSLQIHAVPSASETVISQLARTILGGQGIPYLLVISATTLILIMAANTSFADFPRLSALHAGDGFLPRQLTFKGSRLVYSRGIITLALIASLLIILFRASVTALIPLYAIGVFLSFTLSQTGMARRWWKSGHLTPGEVIEEPGSTLTYDPNWRVKLVINSVGAVATAIVMLVFAVTKFREGAWIIIVLVPILVAGFFTIHHHYKDLAKRLTLEGYDGEAQVSRQRVIVPVSSVHRGTLLALRYARTLSKDITAVHVSTDPADAERVRTKWTQWGEGVRLIILDSPYRQLMEPLLQYIDMIYDQCQPNEIITVVVAEFVPEHTWQNALHTQAALTLRLALRAKPGVIVIDVPYQVQSTSKPMN